MSASPSTWQKLRNLERPPGAPIAGVCAALGRGTPLPAWLWRAAFCLTTIFWGFGLIVYVILAISIPREKSL